MEYHFPTFHGFPPFYTLQPVDATRQNQFQMWEDVILGYCKHNGLHTLILRESLDLPLFNNETIHRRLALDALIKVIDFMQTNGTAEWIGEAKSKNTCVILWLNTKQWADRLYSWISDSGSIGSVFTLFELVSGDGMDKELASLDDTMMRRILAYLENQGKAQIFQGSDGADGVKFFK